MYVCILYTVFKRQKRTLLLYSVNMKRGYETKTFKKHVNNIRYYFSLHLKKVMLTSMTQKKSLYI